MPIVRHQRHTLDRETPAQSRPRLGGWFLGPLLVAALAASIWSSPTLVGRERSCPGPRTACGATTSTARPARSNATLATQNDPSLAETMAKLTGSTGSIVDLYLAYVFAMFGVVVAVYAVQAVLRLRSEETGNRAEPVLATAVTRVGWVGSHALCAAAGSAVVLAEHRIARHNPGISADPRAYAAVLVGMQTGLLSAVAARAPVPGAGRRRAQPRGHVRMSRGLVDFYSHALLSPTWPPRHTRSTTSCKHDNPLPWRSHAPRLKEHDDDQGDPY
jgi:hypothetical protein